VVHGPASGLHARSFFGLKERPCAAVSGVFNPDNLAAAKKRQNRITEYLRMLLAWKAQSILTLAGYILGFPSDTKWEAIDREAWSLYLRSEAY
jgi:hypothetical protein